MRFMLIVKATPASESGAMPTTEELTAMGRFNESLVQAGVLLAGEGLHATRRGVRVRYDGDARTLVEGPFGGAEAPVAGYWLLDVRSREEAVEWARRVPFTEGEVEVRQAFDAEDFAGADPTGELRAAEQALRERAAAQRA